MSDKKDFENNYEKTEDAWPIGVELVEHEISTGIWVTTQWQLTGFALNPTEETPDVCLLQLHKDERTDYRFNLSSQQPKLFLVMDNVESGEKPAIQLLTASQSVAAQYMDGDNLVLSNDMPLAVQAWMEAFIGRHGELLEVRRKKRKGAGRANGN
ncbi:DUF3305 domain-containing protein [Vibrio parahaemolyticus]|jgi:hypothetical protein|uniref:DUF3305 domain-containing protein n=5 Tax=Vibrio TaxID=662 RepID=A0A0F5U1Z9_VIBPH|nr:MULTISPECIES: DUF3305 domain-containing protein [Vibrio]EFO35854.1 conserved hypothetical protein [Vibrio parahaemolyticus Peru-466]EFO47005.1 conserved hypothetical protein [Vibrio parahaemolyticus AQ4037]EFO48916.1 conserved hypothetical protein [Vibrio parahaemolyticus K5030]EJG0874406.1 DUF3305 domain-containing protein [Vibrio parahaemolyticus O3]EJG0903407.1 DUF3305 domain-containing protein [Vibrio parahaemolyticus O3:K56]EJG0941078.1 DUF3305 domain-containing protein [Vibrio paraha